MNRQQVCELIGSPCLDGPDFHATSVTEDSRRAGPGALFVAVPGAKTDGHEYAEAAVRAGAVAVIGDHAGLREYAGVPYLSVPRARRAAGLLAQALAGNPSQTMCIVGVTGTNGKSSTIHLIQQILVSAGARCAKLGTLGYDFGGPATETENTTPFAEDLAKVFAGAVSAGCTHLAMEVSSHALDQERVAGIRFRAAAFTNLTQDHLDYHKSMDAYRAAKLKLFTGLSGDDAVAAVNADDPSAADFLAAAEEVRRVTFGKAGQVTARQVSGTIAGTSFVLDTPWGRENVTMRLLGAHNVANALCAAAVCGGLGVPLAAIARGIAGLPAVPGRFEPINAGQDFFVVVDYAHTDDGLKNVLEAARKLCGGRLICVFGCGGDRDKTKRPKMGAVVATLADFAIVTSDNPRTEDPHRILLDIEVGLQRTGKKKGDDYWVIEDRREAITRAIGLAKAGDFVMIAGKGHEDYQILGTTKIHFDDREIAREVLGAR